ncbi:DUF3558 family protein [Allokutzneria oryzae]|uniref:DUF3558 family protein n=1 Tax=Allokutzneria oryzae TaxID=1378989 RepID=A0ABV6A3E5_9PSEU
MTAAALLVVAFVATGCAQQVRGEALSGPVPTTTARPAGSAPFDPCTVVTWADFPLEVRTVETVKPRHRPPQAADEVFQDGCSFDNNEIGDDGFKAFMTLVVWGSIAKIRVDPKGADDKPVTYGTRRGVQNREVGPDNAKQCITRFTLDYGQVAGVSVMNGRFPDVDPCTVADVISQKIAARVGS